MKTCIPFCTLVVVTFLAIPPASASLVGPTAPTGLVAWPSDVGAITLHWQPASSVVGVSGYRVYHVEADGNLTHVADVPADRWTYTESGLASGVALSYVVSAVDALAEGPASEVANATTWSAPSAPTSVAAASGPGLAGEATLTWSAPEHDGGASVRAYSVYRDGALVATLDAAIFSFTDTGLTPFHAYAYTVSATNVVGEGATSDAACSMPSPWTPELGCTSVL